MNGPQHIEVWNNCLQMIKGVIQPKQYETWFEPIKPVSLVGSTFTIEVPSEFFREYLEAHYISFLSRALRNGVYYDDSISVDIVLDAYTSKLTSKRLLLTLHLLGGKV